MAINEKRSYTEVDVTQPTSDFDIGFKFYEERDGINSTVDGVPAAEAGYTTQLVNGNTLRFTPTVLAGAVVRIMRETNIDRNVYQFSSGALWTAEQMDENFEQIRHSQQESRDSVIETRREFDRLDTQVQTVVAGLDAALEVAEHAAEDAQAAADSATNAVETVNDFVAGGISAEKVKDVSGQTQADINLGLNSIFDLSSVPTPVDGQRVYVKGYYAGTYTGGGTFIYKSTNTSVYDGGVSFGKWRRLFDTLTPHHFGVQGNFSTKLLSDYYATLSDAQLHYPIALALTELLDRVAFGTYLKYLIANAVRTDWTCQILVDAPLPSYTAAKTTLIDGACEVKSYQTYLRYVFHNATSQLVLTGSFKTIGTQSVSNDMRTRYIQHAFVNGANTKLGLTGNATNCDFGTVISSNILGYNLVWATNCHFSRSSMVRGSNCGSANKHPNKYLQGFVDDFTWISTSGGDIGQRSILQMTDTAILAKLDILEQLRFVIEGVPYDVMSIDHTTKQVSVYPALPASLTSGSGLYIFGGTELVDSNNTACTSASTCEAILCGYGLNVPALYGVQIGSFTSEFCGAGIAVSSRGNTTLGTVVDLAYFEANSVDILYGWQLADNSVLRILQTIALNPNKIFNMFAYTMGEYRRRDWALMGYGEVYLAAGAPLTVERPVWELHSPSINSALITGGTLNVTMAYNAKIAELTGRRHKVIHLVSNGNATAIVNITAPTGYTINNAASISIDVNQYSGVVSLALYMPFVAAPNALPTDIKAVVSGTRKITKGTTAQRPTSPTIGQKYYDTTLLAAGKPIEYNGVAWVDSTGATV